jgi:hypothetical protein
LNERKIGPYHEITDINPESLNIKDQKQLFDKFTQDVSQNNCA